MIAITTTNTLAITWKGSGNRGVSQYKITYNTRATNTKLRIDADVIMYFYYLISFLLRRTLGLIVSSLLSVVLVLNKGTLIDFILLKSTLPVSG